MDGGKVLKNEFLLSAIFGLAVASAAAESVDFSRDIRPILSGKCFACHGPDAEARKADLRLDLRENAIEFGTIIPGDPDRSYLMERIITDDPHDRMPPKGDPLSPEEIATFRKWIEDGANYEE
ncbi:MAG: c-type cytochrome domain-containing protein, partial [Verrucomicrobiota bacterium]